MLVEKKDAVAEVVIRTPGKGNALGPDFWRELPETFDALDRDDEVRAVVLRADGDHFTYGLDLVSMMGELGPIVSGGLAEARTKLYDMILRLQDSVSAIARCRKPVVAAVHGACIGGGVDVICACDVRVASRDARFSVREVRVAMVADLGTLQRLPRIVGEGNARELALTGKDIDAERALRIGLVSEVFATREDAWEAARATARAIAENPPLVVQGIKRVMNERVARDDAAGLHHVAAWNAAFLPSEDLGEALAAFGEKRKPRYRGR